MYLATPKNNQVMSLTGLEKEEISTAIIHLVLLV